MLKLDHIGIAVDDLEAAIAHFSTVFGYGPDKREIVPSEHVETVFYEAGVSQAEHAETPKAGVSQEGMAVEAAQAGASQEGDVSIELLGATSPDSAIATFIQKRGEGIHHIAFRVDDLEAHITRLRAAGYRFLSDEPKDGAGGKRIIFMHPKEHHGVLIELCQPKG